MKRPLPGALQGQEEQTPQHGGVTAMVIEKFAALRDERDELKAQLKEAHAKLASYKAQDAAEDVLLRAFEENSNLSALCPSSIPDFVSKRANLAERGEEHIKQASQILEMSIGEGEFAYVSDSDENHIGPNLDGIPLTIHRR